MSPRPFTTRRARVRHDNPARSYGRGAFVCFGDYREQAYVLFDGETAERLVRFADLVEEPALPLAPRPQPVRRVIWPEARP